jgi:pimeloyl-ACP methyl ester carboxylesterase
MVTKIPLVLLPALNTTARLFEAQVQELSDISRPVVPEMTGHDTVGALAEEILAAAPERFALAGLSMGGYVALEIMRRAPHRVDRLALLDTQAGLDTPEVADRRRRLIEIAASGDFERVLTVMPWTDLVATTRASDDSLEAVVYGMAREVGPEAFIRQQRAVMARPDSRPLLSTIGCTALVLVGDDDRITPRERSQEMAAAIPGASLVVIPACGHLSALERPDEVNDALRGWLAL